MRRRVNSVQSMEIMVNGAPRVYPRNSAPLSLFAVMETLGLDGTEQGVAVALNGELVRHADWAGTVLHPDDELEIVQATQGG